MLSTSWKYGRSFCFHGGQGLDSGDNLPKDVCIQWSTTIQSSEEVNSAMRSSILSMDGPGSKINRVQEDRLYTFSLRCGTEKVKLRSGAQNGGLQRLQVVGDSVKGC